MTDKQKVSGAFWCGSFVTICLCNIIADVALKNSYWVLWLVPAAVGAAWQVWVYHETKKGFNN